MKQPLNDEIALFYKSWEKFEYDRNGLESSLFILVDDLTFLEKELFTFSEISEVSDKLESLIAASEKEKISKYLIEKLQNSKEYISSIRSSPEEIDITPEKVMKRGAPFESVPKQRIIDIADKISKSQNLMSEIEITSLTQMLESENSPHVIKSYANQIIKKIPDWILPSPLEWETLSVSSERSWRNIVSFNREKNCHTLMVNTSKNRNYSMWECKALAVHEVCGHILHLTKLRESLGESHNAELAISIHTLDSYYTETVAQTLFYFLAESSNDPELQFLFYKFHLDFVLRNNALVDAINQNNSAEVAVESYIQSLDLVSGPKVNPDLLKTNFQKILSDSFFCAQTFNYVAGVECIIPYLIKSPKVERQIIEFLLTEPRSHADVKAYLLSS